MRKKGIIRIATSKRHLNMLGQTRPFPIPFSVCYFHARKTTCISIYIWHMYVNIIHLHAYMFISMIWFVCTCVHIIYIYTYIYIYTCCPNIGRIGFKQIFRFSDLRTGELREIDLSFSGLDDPHAQRVAQVGFPEGSFEEICQRLV